MLDIEQIPTMKGMSTCGPGCMRKGPAGNPTGPIVWFDWIVCLGTMRMIKIGNKEHKIEGCE